MRQQLGQPNPGYLRGNQRKMLMRELVLNKTSETETVGYFMNVVQSPLSRSYAANSQVRVRYDGLEHGDPDQAPWVLLKSRFVRGEMVTFPISMCADLYNHLLSCAQLRQGELDSSGEAHDAQNSDQIDDETCVFDLSQLSAIEFNDKAVNCSLKILTGQNEVKEGESEKNTEFAKVRRWIQSGPLIEAKDSSPDGLRGLPPHTRTVRLELYEMLLPNLVTFLSDICVRYQHLDQPPQLNFLYSPSGERRFFFDIRNTPYGNRLHIAQVTDLHRSVIGIPLESLVTFRNRLTMLIDALKLEEGEIMRKTLGKYSNRPKRLRYVRPTSTSRPLNSSNARQTQFDQENRIQQQNKGEELKGPMKTKRPMRQNGATLKSQSKPQKPDAEGDHKADEVQECINKDEKEEEVKQKGEAVEAKKKKKPKRCPKKTDAAQDKEKEVEA
ncbi:hypothetical protein TSMEX_011513 [Taenia solium]|eukprot:TsM_000697700 transcript=TsM_000697700 gene=TsM_000697700